MNDSHIPTQYLQYTREGSEPFQTNAAIESLVDLTVNGERWITFHCTPVDLEALATGYLFNEGFIDSFSEVENIHLCAQKDNIDLWLNHPVEKPSTWRKTSGCGGGVSAVEIEEDKIEQIAGDLLLSPSQIFELMDQFMTDQLSHAEFGGVHTSALADGGKQLFQVIDIGRHNTIDKITGRILMDHLKIKTPVIITSGRISSDMAQKASRLSVPFLVSMRSVSHLGITLSERYGITLISGARRGRFFLCSHPERLTSD